MFTFGIFTTHFPYVVFVVFYAYFLIFGVNKAVAGELQGNDSNIKTELQASRSYAHLHDDANFHYQTDFDFYLQAHFEESIFKRKIKYQSTFYAEILQTGFNTIHFSRPPPSLV